MNALTFSRKADPGRRGGRRVIQAIAAVVAALVVAPVPLPASAAQQRLGAPQPDLPPTLTLRIGGTRRFRPGELIPFELIFDGPVEGRFEVSSRSYDRSGRLTIDEYRIEPNELVRDGGLDYFAFFGGPGGGTSYLPDVGQTRLVVSLTLNEWFTFEAPGVYTLSVRSGRVRAGGTGSGPVLPTDSNSETFQILPRDEAWEMAELARGIQLLGGADRRMGCNIVRYLGTNRAVTEMVRRFGEEQDTNRCGFTLGLFMAPDRAFVVRELEAGLRRRDTPVSDQYVLTLAALSVYLAHPELRPPHTLVTKGRWAQSANHERLVTLIDEAVARYSKER